MSVRAEAVSGEAVDPYVRGRGQALLVADHGVVDQGEGLVLLPRLDTAGSAPTGERAEDQWAPSFGE